MASIYARGDVLWMKYKNASGKAECRSTGYRRGQEHLARELAAEVERQVTTPGRPEAPAPDAPMACAGTSDGDRRLRIGPAAARGQLTVRDYGEEWIKRRRSDVATVKDETTRLRLHVFPLIGHMALADVRPRHVRDFVHALKDKTSDSRKCKGEKLAPRTVRHVYALLRIVFKSAVIDEHIAASPVVLEKGVLPKSVDKDPAWRATAIYERDELVTLISDPRIAPYRRVMYALEGLAGVRHGEMAGARWSDYHAECTPLGKLIVARSYENDRTKTQMTRQIPVHPTLATLLGDWRSSGWAQKYGRAPTEHDLMFPTEDHEVRDPSDTLKQLKKDLASVGLRPRRGHDLRRTFITLAQVDGARRDILKTLTHPSETDIVGLYSTFPWATVCAEVAKLQIELPAAAPHPIDLDDLAQRASAASSHVAHHIEPAPQLAATARNKETAAPTLAAAAGYSPSYNPDCSLGITSNFGRLNATPTGFEPVSPA